MQLTIDVDKNFIESLKKEFHTPDIKDALAQLLNFYKEIHEIEEISIEDKDYQYIKDAQIRRQNGEKTYPIDDVLSEYK